MDEREREMTGGGDRRPMCWWRRPSPSRKRQKPQTKDQLRDILISGGPVGFGCLSGVAFVDQPAGGEADGKGRRKFTTSSSSPAER